MISRFLLGVAFGMVICFCILATLGSVLPQPIAGQIGPLIAIPIVIFFASVVIGGIIFSEGH